MASFRIEKHSLGEMKIPNTADYGIHTARVVESSHHRGFTQSLSGTDTIARHGEEGGSPAGGGIHGWVSETVLNCDGTIPLRAGLKPFGEE